MPKKYDAALRDRVICAVDRGMSARAAAARFEVGVATAIRWRTAGGCVAGARREPMPTRRADSAP